MLPLLSTWRDFREFVEAKKRKREPLRFVVKPVAEAIYVPSSPQGFARFRATLRGVGHWGQASERLDALEHALRARHAHGLPMPRKVVQNEDRSLSLWFGGAEHIMVRCFPDRFFALIGGAKGLPLSSATRELLDALAFQARIAAAS